MTPLKVKILMLSVLPLLLVTSIITAISLIQAHQLSELEIQIFEENIHQSKRRELQNYVSMAETSISPLVQHADLDNIYVQEQIKAIVNSMNYGEDGYFFVYDQEGRNLVHSRQPELVGQVLFDLQDNNGSYVIRELLSLADQGGGFFRYIWRKPSTGIIEDKLSYVVKIPKLNWMLGTGLYLDDIAGEVSNIRHQVNENIRKTFITVLLIVSVTVLIIIVLAVAINVHATQQADIRLRELAQKYVSWQVGQRRRFARDLHDGINQLMVSVKFRIELANEKIIKQKPNAEQELEKGLSVLNQAIHEVRQISHDLRPSLLDDLGLESALDALISDFRARTGQQVNQQVSLPNQRLPDEIEITLYRLLQETLTNIEKHANSTEVSLTVWFKGDKIWMEVEDNGVGFQATDSTGDQEGIGLVNMRERTELISGSFELVSKQGQGTLIRVGFSLRD